MKKTLIIFILFLCPCMFAQEHASFSVDGSPVISNISIVIPDLKWKNIVSVNKNESKGSLKFGEIDAEYISGWKKEGKADKYEFILKPKADLLERKLVFRLEFPLKLFKGASHFISEDGKLLEKTFPADLPEKSYIFYNTLDFKWIAVPVSPGSKSEKWVLIKTVSKNNGHVQIQDDRKFNGTSYELQLYVEGRELKAGEECNAGAIFEVLSKEEFEKILKEERKNQIQMSSKEKLSIVEINSPKEVVCLQKYEIAVKITGTYDNPFNPSDVSVKAHVISPSGKEITVNGFYYQGFEEKGGALRSLTPCFKIRFCPAESGNFVTGAEYKYWIEAKDRNGSIKSEAKSFNCKMTVANGNFGYLKVSKENPLYFSYGDSNQFIPVGQNVCWANSIAEYENYFKKMAQNRENYARIWVGPFDMFTLEMVGQGKDDYAGLGKYELKNAWQLDRVVELAEKYGIYIMFCIDSFNSLRDRPTNNMWVKNPYNKANGGPCENPEDFFTSAEAKKIYKQRLDYIVARYSYSIHIFAWEFWNEVDIVDNYNPEAVTPWHKEMAAYLKNIDMNKHLVTTSYGGIKENPEMDSLKDLDFIQSHHYGARDSAELISRISIEKAKKYGKPHLFGEFGADVEGSNDTKDKDGINLHNGIWAAPFSLSAGTGMLWWWDNYIEPNNLYYHFKAFSIFIQDINFAKSKFDVTACEFGLRGKDNGRAAYTLIEGKHSIWKAHPSNQLQNIIVSASGEIIGAENLSRQLHGMWNHKDKHNPVTFEVENKLNAGVKFSVLVDGVSDHGGARLNIYLDGELKLKNDFEDDDKKRTGTMHQYDGEYSIVVPAGKHKIKVENDGVDWINAGYSVPYLTEKPPLTGYALSDQISAHDLVGLVWIKNEAFTWYRQVVMKEPLEMVKGATCTLPGFKDGEYRAEFWDTFKGEKTSEAIFKSQSGKLQIKLSDIEKDVAVKIFIK